MPNKHEHFIAVYEKERARLQEETGEKYSDRRISLEATGSHDFISLHKRRNTRPKNESLIELGKYMGVNWLEFLLPEERDSEMVAANSILSDIDPESVAGALALICQFVAEDFENRNLIDRLIDMDLEQHPYWTAHAKRFMVAVDLLSQTSVELKDLRRVFQALPEDRDPPD